MWAGPWRRNRSSVVSDQVAEGRTWAKACHTEVKCWFIHLQLQAWLISWAPNLSIQLYLTSLFGCLKDSANLAWPRQSYWSPCSLSGTHCSPSHSGLLLAFMSQMKSHLHLWGLLKMQISGLSPSPRPLDSPKVGLGVDLRSQFLTRYPQLISMLMFHGHILRNTAMYRKHTQECWERRGEPVSVGVQGKLEKRQQLRAKAWRMWRGLSRQIRL